MLNDHLTVEDADARFSAFTAIMAATYKPLFNTAGLYHGQLAATGLKYKATPMATCRLHVRLSGHGESVDLSEYLPAESTL